MKRIFFVLFLVTGTTAYSQSWNLTQLGSGPGLGVEPPSESSRFDSPRQGTEEEPLVVKLLIANPPAELSANKIPSSGNGSSGNGWIALFCGLLFVSTTALWWVTYQLWLALKDQSADTKRSIEIAQKSVAALEKIVLALESVPE